MSEYRIFSNLGEIISVVESDLIVKAENYTEMYLKDKVVAIVPFNFMISIIKTIDTKEEHHRDGGIGIG